MAGKTRSSSPSHRRPRNVSVSLGNSPANAAGRSGGHHLGQDAVALSVAAEDALPASVLTRHIEWQSLWTCDRGPAFVSDAPIAPGTARGFGLVGQQFGTAPFLEETTGHRDPFGAVGLRLAIDRSGRHRLDRGPRNSSSIRPLRPRQAAPRYCLARRI